MRHNPGGENVKDFFTGMITDRIKVFDYTDSQSPFFNMLIFETHEVYLVCYCSVVVFEGEVKPCTILAG